MTGDDVSTYLDHEDALDPFEGPVDVRDADLDDHEHDLVARMARDELLKLRARKMAQDAQRAADRPPRTPLDAGTLAEVLARPEPPRDRVAGLIPWDASTLLVAQRKTGKTTAVLNLARALLLGEDYLDRFPVRPVRGSVGILNFEVSAAQLARWAHEHGVPVDRLFLVNLRGRSNPLDTDEDRAELAALLRAQQVETLIVDPFGRAYSGESQNDAATVGQWLVRLDTFARAQVGALDLVLAAHAGWNGERSRGSSALEDWADVVITITRDENTDARFLRAEGRDVHVDEDRLDFDPETRRLSLSGDGSRKTAASVRKTEDLLDPVLAIVRDHPGVTGYGVANDLRARDVPHQKGDHAKALELACQRGVLTFDKGPRGAKCYRLTDSPTPTYPDVPQRVTSPPTPTSPYGGGVGGVGGEALTYPEQLPTSETSTRAALVCVACHEPMLDLGDGALTHPGCGGPR